MLLLLVVGYSEAPVSDVLLLSHTSIYPEFTQFQWQAISVYHHTFIPLLNPFKEWHDGTVIFQFSAQTVMYLPLSEEVQSATDNDVQLHEIVGK